MNCPHCYQPVEGHNSFCPYCGARLAEPGEQTALEATQDPTYGALAYANLMRLRGDWEGARDKTVSVMREFPNSGTAHSLMGDIYADQQMYEEASQWYRMAVDLEPNNAADVRKLAAAERHLHASAAAPDNVLDIPSRFNVFRVAAVAAMVFLVFAISLGFYVKMHSVSPVDLGPTWSKPPAGPIAPNAPGQQADSVKPDGADAPAGFSAPAAAVGFGGTPVHTERETELANAMNVGVSKADSVLRFVDVAIDPRDGTAVVTMSADQLDGSSLNWMVQLYTAAASAAERALKSDADLSAVTIRVVMRLEGEHGIASDVAFIGVMPRTAEPAVSTETAPIGFARRWWSPGLRPPSSLANTSP